MTQVEWVSTLAQYTSESNDPPELGVFVGDLVNVRLICAAWGHCPKQVRPERVSVEDSSDWMALWRAVEFDKETLRRMSGVPSHEFEDALFIAKSNHLIYPNGTLSRWVRAKLYSMTADLFSKGTTKKGRGTDGRPKSDSN